MAFAFVSSFSVVLFLYHVTVHKLAKTFTQPPIQIKMYKKSTKITFSSIFFSSFHSFLFIVNLLTIFVLFSILPFSLPLAPDSNVHYSLTITIMMYIFPFIPIFIGLSECFYFLLYIRCCQYPRLS